jgi:hypothetical protein
MSQPSAEPRRHHRPAPYADLTAMIDAAGGTEAESAAALASRTAAAVLTAGRSTSGDADMTRWVELADVVGIDTLAALWQHADPVTLPRTLWTVYLLRQWCRTQPDEVERLWRAGSCYAPVDAVVAGVGDGGANPMQTMTEAVLAGIYGGDVAVALERAAAFLRVIAAGRRAVAPLERTVSIDRLAARNDRAARDLALAAQAWRDGVLG